MEHPKQTSSTISTNEISWSIHLEKPHFMVSYTLHLTKERKTRSRKLVKITRDPVHDFNYRTLHPNFVKNENNSFYHFILRTESTDQSTI